MGKKTWFNQILVYVLWVILIALGFWFLIISREAFLFAGTYYSGGSIVRGWQVRFWDKVFFLLIGLLVLVFIIATENYLREGIAKHDMLRRFAKVAGWTLIAIGGMDVILLFLQQLAGTAWLRWLIIVAEVVGGFVLIYLGRRTVSARLPQSTREGNDAH